MQIKNVREKFGFLTMGILTVLLAAAFNLNVFAQDAAIAAEGFERKNVTKTDNDTDIARDEESITESDGAPDIAMASSYVFATTTSGSLTDMSTGTTGIVAGNQDDTASTVQTIGFDFYFQGVRYTQFSANSNGLMRLGGTVVQGGSPYQPLAQAGIPLITPYGADQRTHTSGLVRFKVIGAAPNRVLVVEWFNMQSTFNTGGTADLTYQARLYETTGVIEFVYGSMTMSAAGAADGNSNDPQIGFSSTNTAGNVGSVTAPQDGMTTPTFNGASATPTNNLYTTAGAITVLTSATDGARRTFSFTPPVPSAPTALNFTGITATSITLNWTDSPDEDLYSIFRSTDGVNYTFVTTLAENAVTYTDNGRIPSTNYFYQVFAVSEGALSTALAGTQMTGAPGNDTCAGAGGGWNTPATWADGTVPTTGDNVIINAGCTVTIDTAAAALSLTVQNGGTLRYDVGTARSLTVETNVTVDAGGTFTAGTGALATHTLIIGGSAGSGAAGNLTVNGDFDMNTTAGVATTFFGSSNGAVSGTGATCDFFTIIVNKGTGNGAILDVTRVITMSSPTASGIRLTTTNGTFRLSSASALTPYFGSQTIIAAGGRVWINDAGASITVVGVGTATGGGSPTIAGTLQVDAGTFGYGSGNNTMTVNNGGSIINNGGTINMFGAVQISAGANFTMTAGNFNVDPQAANSLGATTNIFRFNTANVTFTGGTLTIVDPHAATGTGTAFSISASSAASFNMVGSTIQFGNGVSTTAGSADGFDIDPWVSTALVPLGNVTINNPVSTNRHVRAANALPPNQQIYGGNLTLTNAGGSEFRLNGHLVAIGGNVVNEGTINGSPASSRFYLNGSAPQTISGGGTFTAPLNLFDVDNPTSVTITHTNQIVTLRVNLFRGTVINSNKLTIGNGGATSSIVQIGIAGATAPGGSFDAAPTFNAGTGGDVRIYGQETTPRTTGFEIPASRTITTLAVDNTNGVTVAGGNLTVTGTMTLTNGVVTTSAANTLIHNGATAARTNGFVDGPLRRQFAAVGAYTYFVGEGGYTPVAANVTAIGAPGDGLTVESVDATLGGFNAATSLSRNWDLTENGAITADLTFTYLDPGDVNGNEADYRVYKREGDGTITNLCPGGPCVDTAANTLSVTGISDFSRWTGAELFVPTAATVNVGGRVITPSGRGVAGARVFMTDLDGNVVMRQTNSSGYYRFIDVSVGETYVMSVNHKTYRFNQPTQVFFLGEENLNVNFITSGLNTDSADELPPVVQTKGRE